jgi:hypothetical protein
MRLRPETMLRVQAGLFNSTALAVALEKIERDKDHTMSTNADVQHLQRKRAEARLKERQAKVAS